MKKQCVAKRFISFLPATLREWREIPKADIRADRQNAARKPTFRKDAHSGMTSPEDDMCALALTVPPERGGASKIKE
jgi:hypothetical protein